MQSNVLKLVNNIEKVIIGKKLSVIKMVLAMLCNGHVLIEDLPGTGKTQLVLALSQSVAGVFHRLQLTPDITPSDIIGLNTMDAVTKRVTYKEGVLKCNFLLADEINRAAAKVQSGLLEAMEEKQISVGGVTYPLPVPFLVFATQNPVENYGTHHLPEAQIDRFFMKLSMGYPARGSEMEILENNREKRGRTSLEPVLDMNDVVFMQKQIDQIEVREDVKNYILDLVWATRHNDDVLLGISPRGSINLHKAARGLAFMDERDYVTVNDVKGIAMDILSHRMILSQEGQTKYKDTRAYINFLLDEMPVVQKIKYS